MHVGQRGSRVKIVTADQNVRDGWKTRRYLVGTLLLMAVISSPLPASEASPPDPYSRALKERYNLEYDAARETLQTWLAQHPDDLHALNDLATVVLQREMFYRGILASHIYDDLGGMFKTGKIPYSPNFRQNLFGILDKAQGLAEHRLAANPNDQEALYWAGVAHATRAVFYFTMAKSYLAALSEATAARKLHQQLLNINPNFVDAWLVVGLNDYVAGSLPWYIKVVASLAGFRGDKQRGIEEVHRAAEHGKWARDDARLTLAILYRREKLYPETLQVLLGLQRDYPRNFLLQREIAGIYQIQGDLKSAAQVYDSMVERLDKQEPGYADMPAARVLFEAGQVHAQLGETKVALAQFERASTLPANDIFVYRAELAAANLCVTLDRRPEALRRYERIANAIPETDEGKAAKRALKKFRGGKS